MSISVTLSSLPSLFSYTSQTQSQSQLKSLHPLTNSKTFLKSNIPRIQSSNPDLASKRSYTFTQANVDAFDDRRVWSRPIAPEYMFEGDDDDDDESEDEEGRSLDLLVKFVENVFKKVSRRARKAVRSVLPRSISTQLVSFSVNGVLVLAFLWILKAFLEVICTLGSVVFTSILLIRGIWSGVTYLQESRIHNQLNDDRRAWSGPQPAT